MLRVAGRRLSSPLSWRPAAAAGARGPLAGATGPGRDDDDNSARQPRFAIDSPFFTAVRGIRGLVPPSPHLRTNLVFLLYLICVASVDFAWV